MIPTRAKRLKYWLIRMFMKNLATSQLLPWLLPLRSPPSKKINKYTKKIRQVPPPPRKWNTYKRILRNSPINGQMNWQLDQTTHIHLTKRQFAVAQNKKTMDIPFLAFVSNLFSFYKYFPLKFTDITLIWSYTKNISVLSNILN